MIYHPLLTKKQNNHTDMKEDGDNLLSHLAARQRGTRNSKISFEIFKKVFLGRQLKQVKRRFIANTNMTLYRNFRIQSHLSRPVGNQSRQRAGFSLSTRKALKQKGLIVNTVMMVIVIFLIVNQEGSQEQIWSL